MNLDKAVELVIENGSTGNNTMTIKRRNGEDIWTGKTVDFIMKLEDWRSKNVEICSTASDTNGNSKIYLAD